jgi:protein tyrosine phosphatase (PTP) superfamily phosphohydrolase (DUF442 family)
MNLSQITHDLYIGNTPGLSDYDRLRGLGIRLVINMRYTLGPRPDPHVPPLEFLWLRTFDNIFIPIPIPKLIEGAQRALDVIANGGKVLAHCAYGRHRGVAMGASILIAQGYAPRAAMDLIKEKRAFADPDAFYIRSRILKFAEQWQAIKQDFRSL